MLNGKSWLLCIVFGLIGVIVSGAYFYGRYKRTKKQI